MPPSTFQERIIMKYMLTLNTTIDDFMSIVPVLPEFESKGLTFKQAKKELIKLYFQRINSIRKITEKEYFHADYRPSLKVISGSDGKTESVDIG